MRRLFALFGHAVGAARRRAGRSLALTLALAFTTSASASVFFLGESLRATSDALLAAGPRLSVQRLVGGRPGLLSPDDLRTLDGLPSVRRITPRVWGYLYQAALEGNVVVSGVGHAEWEELGSDLGTDSGPEVRELAPDEAWVGSVLAASLGLRVGDRLALVGTDDERAVLVLRIAGVLPPETAVSHGDAVIATPDTARALLDVPPGHAVDAVLDVFPPEEAFVVSERVLERLPSARVVDRDSLMRRRSLTFEARAGLLSAALLPLLFAFLVLITDRLSGLSEGERREIGILKAVGWSTRDVLTARMLESGTIAALGTGVGLCLAYGFVFLLGAPGLIEAYLGWSNLRAPVQLVPAVDGEVLVFLFAIVLAPFLAASVFPSWRAATIDPERAVRGDA